MASSSRPYTPPLPYKTSFASHRDHTAVAIRLAHTVTHPYLRPPHPTNVHSDVNPTTNSEPILSTLPLVYRPAPSFSHVRTHSTLSQPFPLLTHLQTRLIRLHATHNTRIPPQSLSTLHTSESSYNEKSHPHQF
ncbi:hypothetical protein C8Q80DRAFT_212486 [Daedaleopsis nitida]|nr:hypothetical protein C8Q80DRAFT_212486 [Daedaleopsis nitida]